MEKITKLINHAPSAIEFQHLRLSVGMTPRDIDSIDVALENTIYGVYLRNEKKELIGMGRLIGDGGVTYQISDIAVHPDYQGQGYAKMIMTDIMKYISEEVPAHAYISLIADGDAKHLYEKYGFSETAPKSVGMFLKRDWK